MSKNILGNGCGIGPFCVSANGSKSKLTNPDGECESGFTKHSKPFINSGGEATGCFSCPGLGGGWENNTQKSAPEAFNCLKQACGKIPDKIPSGWCSPPSWECKCSSLIEMSKTPVIIHDKKGFGGCRMRGGRF